MQQQLTGSSAILVHGTALCLLSLGETDHEDQDPLGADIRVCIGSEEHSLGGTLERFTALPRFAAMRKLAMNFRAILFGADPARLDAWLTEANASSPHHIRSFAEQIQYLEAVHVR
jgi:hypothetical protein